MRSLLNVALATLAAGCMLGAEMTPEVKSKVESKLRFLHSWSTDPEIVAAVKAYNLAPPPTAKEMTNAKWKGLSLMDPTVRAYSKNPLAEHLKSKKDPSMSEIFVSAANGDKVAFLAKTTSWCHKGSAKHDVPMTGKSWVGTPELDQSTGLLEVQVSVPVLDAGKPIGSIVIGLSATKLN